MGFPVAEPATIGSQRDARWKVTGMLRYGAPSPAATWIYCTVAVSACCADRARPTTAVAAQVCVNGFGCRDATMGVAKRLRREVAFSRSRTRLKDRVRHVGLAERAILAAELDLSASVNVARRRCAVMRVWASRHLVPRRPRLPFLPHRAVRGHAVDRALQLGLMPRPRSRSSVRCPGVARSSDTIGSVRCEKSAGARPRRSPVGFVGRFDAFVRRGAGAATRAAGAGAAPPSTERTESSACCRTRSCNSRAKDWRREVIWESRVVFIAVGAIEGAGRIVGTDRGKSRTGGESVAIVPEAGLSRRLGLRYSPARGRSRLRLHTDR